MTTLDKLLELTKDGNIAAKLDEEQLNKIAEKVIEGYQIDRESRAEWEKRCEDAIKFAKQIVPQKSFPWDGAANVVYPLLTVACNVFAARIYPEIIKDDKVVKVAVFGEDADNSKRARADRVSAHMSYQRLEESDTWEPDTDKLLHILPLVGVCFRKVYFDTDTGMPQSDLCAPEDIIVNHNTASLGKAQRITHRYYITKNDLVSRIRQGFYRDVDIDKLNNEVRNDGWDTSLDDKKSNTQDIEYEILEQHTFYDLDGDGYEEPYICFVLKNNSTVLAIQPRFSMDYDVDYSEAGEIIKIKPETYFVDYHFLPSPDGGFYSLGYGHVLYPLNKAINSILNQLIDAGTLANTQSGLISRQLKIKGGKLEMQMGQFTPVDAGTTGRVSDAIFPFPFKEPSPVLMQLLGLVIESAKEIAAINDVLTGAALPQNAPANSVSELASQGMKLHSSIAKRLYRSLKKEFQLLYKLNQEYLSPEVYFEFHDQQQAISQADYEGKSLNIKPIADPNMSSEMQRTAKVNGLIQVSQHQLAPQYLKGRTVFEEMIRALKFDDAQIKALVKSDEELAQEAQNRQPSIEQQELQLEMQKIQLKAQVDVAAAQDKQRATEIKYIEMMRKYDIKVDESEEKQMKTLSEANYKDRMAGSVEYDSETKRIQAEAQMEIAKNMKSESNKHE